jgi:hypothetical protein
MPRPISLFLNRVRVIPMERWRKPRPKLPVQPFTKGSVALSLPFHSDRCRIAGNTEISHFRENGISRRIDGEGRPLASMSLLFRHADTGPGTNDGARQVRAFGHPANAVAGLMFCEGSLRDCPHLAKPDMGHPEWGIGTFYLPTLVAMKLRQGWGTRSSVVGRKRKDKCKGG